MLNDTGSVCFSQGRFVSSLVCSCHVCIVLFCKVEDCLKMHPDHSDQSRYSTVVASGRQRQHGLMGTKFGVNPQWKRTISGATQNVSVLCSSQCLHWPSSVSAGPGNFMNVPHQETWTDNVLKCE